MERPECQAISGILSRIGDKWTVLVVNLLGQGPKRFSEIKREVGGISQRMLTLTLRALERDGLVTRTVHPTVPPSVEYALTELGRSLRVPVQALRLTVAAGVAMGSLVPGVDAALERMSAGTTSMTRIIIAPAAPTQAAPRPKVSA